MISFQYNDERWQVKAHEAMAEEFGLKEHDFAACFAALNDAASANPAAGRRLRIVKRLFGIVPLFSMTADPKDLKIWGRQELMNDMGITAAQLRQELQAARGVWQRVSRSPESDAPKDKPPEKPWSGELDLQADDERLKRHGFHAIDMTTDQKQWFVDRIREFHQILEEKTTRSLARTIILTEFEILRLERKVFNVVEAETLDSDRKRLDDKRKELTSQMESLKKLAPWATEVKHQVNFTATLSDLVAGIQDYHARGDTAKIDGIFTATEIQVLLRRSQQAPDPRYRAGLIVHLNHARAGLWDPNWKPAFKPEQLKKIDASWTAAARAAGEELGEELPDLEGDGEYEPIYLPDANRSQ